MKLAEDQARLYSERIAKMLGWIVRARKRMEQRGIGGELYRKTMKAEDALMALRISAHYASCPDITGGPAE